MNIIKIKFMKSFYIQFRIDEINLIDNIKLGKIPNRQHGQTRNQKNIQFGEEKQIPEISLQEFYLLHLFKLIPCGLVISHQH